MKLLIGVIDMPEPEGSTTFEVATKLEAKYGLFSSFAENNMPFITDQLMLDSSNTFAAILKGEPVGDPFGDASNAITDRFKQFISNSEAETVGLPNVPTQAALAGLTLRTKKGKAIGKVRKGGKYVRVYGSRRPSFIYSGVMESSLKCWVE